MTLHKTIIALTIVVAVFSSCDYHYYAVDGSCAMCDITCLQCKDTATTCTACQEQYFLQNTTCFPCDASCLTCSNMLNCSICAQGYRMQNNICVPCGVNCAKCSSSSCSICKAGYDMSSNCSNCTSGFYWNANVRKCQLCAVGCSSCNATGACLSCWKNYKYADSTCIFQFSATTNTTHLSEDGSQVKVQIILTTIFGAIFVIIVIAYIVYRACFHKRNQRVNGNNAVSADFGALDLSKSDSINQVLSNRDICFICNAAEADRTFSCGHHFHSRCISGKESQCGICSNKIKEVPLYLEDVLGQSENASEMSSQAPRQDIYRVDDSSISGSIMEMPTINIK